jgi:hypothetical protein
MLTLAALVGCGVGSDEPVLEQALERGEAMTEPSDAGVTPKSPAELAAEQVGALRVPASPAENHFFYPVDVSLTPPPALPTPCKACW